MIKSTSTDFYQFRESLFIISYLQDHSYDSGICNNCVEDKVDKLLIWEPNVTTAIKGQPKQKIAACYCGKSILSNKVIISKTDRLNVDMVIDGNNAATNYFKHDNALFEASYEFIHSPLCGPTLIESSTDGEILFPFYDAIGYVSAPKKIHCIWEIKVNRERDLWLHIDHIKFITNFCDDSVVKVYLKNRINNPILSVCVMNSSLAKELPIISSSELDSDNIEPSIRIEFIAKVTPIRTSLKIAWTELFHLPRNSDGKFD